MVDAIGIKYEHHTLDIYSHPVLQALHKLADLATVQRDFSQQLPILHGR